MPTVLISSTSYYPTKSRGDYNKDPSDNRNRNHTIHIRHPNGDAEGGTMGGARHSYGRGSPKGR